MTTYAPGPVADRLPDGAERIRDHGLLSSVGRPCPEHGGECGCVARDADHGCLIYWCERGTHHFSAR